MPKQKWKVVPIAKVNREPGIHLHKTKPRGNSKPQWYWILISKNGKTIAKSSESYVSRRGAVKSIEWVHEHFDKNAHYYDHTEKGYEASANLIAL